MRDPEDPDDRASLTDRLDRQADTIRRLYARLAAGKRAVAAENIRRIAPQAKLIQLSARTGEGESTYGVAREIGAALGRRGFTVVTGGGPGIMEAANQGAHQAGGRSVGLGIALPFEQEHNPYITPELDLEFHYFFVRKYWFLYLAKALVVECYLLTIDLRHW